MTGLKDVSELNKQIFIWIAVIAAALLIAAAVSYQIKAEHQADCNNHKVLLERAEQDFPNGTGLNGETIPQIQYLNDHCGDLGIGPFTIH